MTGIERIKNAFTGDRPAFMPYSVLGYPTRQAGLEVIKNLAEAGADLLELGLPFSDLFTVIEKDSVSVAIGTGKENWLASHPEVTTFLVVGDCTDFCTHQLAMHLRLRANAFQLRNVRVIVPMDGVDTFDIPVETAEELGIMPHDGDLFHLLFLFNMAQNGIEVVASVG